MIALLDQEPLSSFVSCIREEERASELLLLIVLNVYVWGCIIGHMVQEKLVSVKETVLTWKDYGSINNLAYKMPNRLSNVYVLI